MRLKELIGCFAVLSSALYVSDSFAGCSDLSCSGRVSQLYVNGSGDVMVKLDQPMSTMNCTLRGGEYTVLKSQHNNRDDIYSLLLAAHIANKDGVTVRVVEGSPDCEIQYVRSVN